MKAIFFDRDGTLNVDVNYLKSVHDLKYLDGVQAGLVELSKLGFKFFVVTNQSGIARGIISEEELKIIHETMRQDFLSWGIKFEEFYVCPALPDSGHPWRKPAPGMLLEGIRSRNLDAMKCWMVGDKSIDIEAGKAAGVRTILIHPSPQLLDLSRAEPDFKVKSFSDVVKTIKENPI